MTLHHKDNIIYISFYLNHYSPRNKKSILWAEILEIGWYQHDFTNQKSIGQKIG